MSFEKMYLVTESEMKQLKKRTKLPPDVQLVTDSLKAVVKKRRKENTNSIVPRMTKLRRYDVGVKSMSDQDVVAGHHRTARHRSLSGRRV